MASVMLPSHARGGHLAFMVHTNPNATTPASQPLQDADEHALQACGEIGYLHSQFNASTVDGPGFRYVVWLMGCHMRCQYCHNPDTRAMPAQGTRCKPEEILSEVARYSAFLRAAGGGFTVSGGEPLVQAPFAMKLFRGARQLGLHTALDTNGYLGAKLSDEDLADIDLVLLDLKAFDDTQHRRVTGLGNHAVLEFAERLATLKRPTWIRFVLVPGLTDEPDDMQQLAHFVADLPNVERLEVLPFHQMGRDKWHKLDLHYPLQDKPAATSEQAEAARAVFLEAGCAVL